MVEGLTSLHMMLLSYPHFLTSCSSWSSPSASAILCFHTDSYWSVSKHGQLLYDFFHTVCMEDGLIGPRRSSYMQQQSQQYVKWDQSFNHIPKNLWLYFVTVAISHSWFERQLMLQKWQHLRSSQSFNHITLNLIFKDTTKYVRKLNYLQTFVVPKSGHYKLL